MLDLFPRASLERHLSDQRPHRNTWGRRQHAHCTYFPRTPPVAAQQAPWCWWGNYYHNSCDSLVQAQHCIWACGVAMLYTPSRKHTTSWPRPRRTHHTTHHTTPHQKHIQQNTPTNTRHTTPHHTTPTTTRNRTSNTYHTPHRTHYATQHHTHISAATMSEQPCDTTPHPPSTRRKQCITCVLWNSSE